MGENRFFYVESKSFEITKKAFEVRIIERGRKHLSNVSMGFAAALWLRDALLEVAKLSNDQNLFRSFREGKKVYVVQKQKNGRGSFASVTVLGDSKSRDCVIIPEGRDTWGWRGFSHEMDHLLRPKVVEQQGVNSCRPEGGTSTAKSAQVVQHVAGPAKGKDLYAAVVSSSAVSDGNIKGKQAESDMGEILKIVQDSQPKIDTLTLNMENADSGKLGAAMGALQISLNIQLARGLDGVWGVKCAHVIGPTQSLEENYEKPITAFNEAGPRLDNKPITAPNAVGPKLESKARAKPKRSRTRFQKPKKTKFAWRPKSISKPKPIPSQPASLPTTSQQSDSPGPALTFHHVPEASSSSGSPQTPDSDVTALVPHSGEAVTRTWGSSSDWVLELRDGRRLSIPVSLLRPNLGEFHEPESSGFSGLGEMVCVGGDTGISDEFSAEEGDDEGESVMGDDSEISTKDGVVTCWEGEEIPLEVIPLASVVPQEGVGVKGLSAMGEAGADVTGLSDLGKETSASTPSEWVLGKYHLFGEYVGASYEGCEEEVLALLKSIDARRISTESGGEFSDKSGRSGRKGIRELKALVSNINYDAGSSRSRGSNRGRALMLSQ